MSLWRSVLPTCRLFHTASKNLRAVSTKNASDVNKLLLEKNLLHKITQPVTETAVFRCTLFNKETGTTTSKYLTRAELISKYGLFPRDLRKIEKTRQANTETIPFISVRKSSILLNMLHLKALIMADSVILFDDLGSRFSYTQSEFVRDLETRLRDTEILQIEGNKELEKKNKSIALEHGSELDYRDFGHDDLPYELKSLEVVLESVIKNLTAEMKVHSTVTQGILHELEEDVTRDKLRFLLIQNKKISTFTQKATLIRDVIDELLDNDDDLANCYLTAKLQGNPRAIDDHAEVEMLLESYYKHSDEIVQNINHLISNVKTTEEIINIILDSNRNQLMLLGLRFSIGLLSLGGGMFIGSAYGMNLENFIEETNYGFGLVVGFTFFPMAFLLIYSLKHLNKLQKITIMGDRYKKMKK